MKPLTIRVADDAIDDLHERLSRTRWPGEIRDGGWTYGANLAYMREFCAYWRDTFDWRAQEAALNAMPQFTAEIDGYRVHFVHQASVGPDPLPLIFTHGWPGSFYEVHKVLGPLTDPAAHGGDPADAFTVVAPSLPGYGFSEIFTRRGYSRAAETAQLWDRLMSLLGYDRYGAQGGDWGAHVSARLAALFPLRVVGAHLNMPSAVAPPRGDRDARTPQEEAFLQAQRTWQREEAGYQRIQGTRPQTLAYALTDSPAGLAAWIVEKWRAWSDCHGDVESRFSKDELLTNIALYWFSGTIHTSMHRYYEWFHDPAHDLLEPITVPIGAALFPAEIARPPRSWVERACNLVHWSEFDRGGHFAAMEEPELLVQDVRAFFRPLR